MRGWRFYLYLTPRIIQNFKIFSLVFSCLHVQAVVIFYQVAMWQPFELLLFVILVFFGMRNLGATSFVYWHHNRGVITTKYSSILIFMFWCVICLFITLFRYLVRITRTLCTSGYVIMDFSTTFGLMNTVTFLNINPS